MKQFVHDLMGTNGKEVIPLPTLEMEVWGKVGVFLESMQLHDKHLQTKIRKTNKL